MPLIQHLHRHQVLAPHEKKNNLWLKIERNESLHELFSPHLLPGPNSIISLHTALISAVP